MLSISAIVGGHLVAQGRRGGLGVEAQARQRRAQVVRHRADHRRAILDIAPQPVLQVVEARAATVISAPP
ncbi:MAG: hypothetical protein WDM92_11360 [Caulobacteraceae bacterium]